MVASMSCSSSLFSQSLLWSTPWCIPNESYKRSSPGARHLQISSGIHCISSSSHCPSSPFDQLFAHSYHHSSTSHQPQVTNGAGHDKFSRLSYLFLDGNELKHHSWGYANDLWVIHQKYTQHPSSQAVSNLSLFMFGWQNNFFGSLKFDFAWQLGWALVGGGENCAYDRTINHIMTTWSLSKLFSVLDAVAKLGHTQSLCDKNGEVRCHT
jgi:hypothetical protein